MLVEGGKGNESFWNKYAFRSENIAFRVRKGRVIKQ